jgi:integrase
MSQSPDKTKTRPLAARQNKARINGFCASSLLAAGVDLKTVSERLGHSSIAITADVYTLQ